MTGKTKDRIDAWAFPLSIGACLLVAGNVAANGDGSEALALVTLAGWIGLYWRLQRDYARFRHGAYVERHNVEGVGPVLKFGPSVRIGQGVEADPEMLP